MTLAIPRLLGGLSVLPLLLSVAAIGCTASGSRGSATDPALVPNVTAAATLPPGLPGQLGGATANPSPDPGDPVTGGSVPPKGLVLRVPPLGADQFLAYAIVTADGSRLGSHVETSEEFVVLPEIPGEHAIEVSVWSRRDPAARPWLDVPVGEEGSGYQLEALGLTASRSGPVESEVLEVATKPVPAPAVTGISDTVAMEGYEVALYGEHLRSRSHSQFSIRFGGQELTPRASSDTEISFVIPTWAVSSTVSVRVDGREATWQIKPVIWLVDSFELFVPPKFALGDQGVAGFPGETLQATVSYDWVFPPAGTAGLGLPPDPAWELEPAAGSVDQSGLVTFGKQASSGSLMVSLGTLESDPLYLETADCPAGKYYTATVLSPLKRDPSGYGYEPAKFAGINSQESALAIDSADNLYVLDTTARQISKYGTRTNLGGSASAPLFEAAGSVPIGVPDALLERPAFIQAVQGKVYFAAMDDSVRTFAADGGAGPVFGTKINSLAVVADKLFVTHSSAAPVDAYNPDGTPYSSIPDFGSMPGWPAVPEIDPIQLYGIAGSLDRLYAFVGSYIVKKDKTVDDLKASYLQHLEQAKAVWTEEAFGAANVIRGQLNVEKLVASTAVFDSNEIASKNFAIFGDPLAGGWFLATNGPRIAKFSLGAQPRPKAPYLGWPSVTIAGSVSAEPEDGFGTETRFQRARTLAVASNGDIYAADGPYVRRISPCPP